MVTAIGGESAPALVQPAQPPKNQERKDGPRIAGVGSHAGGDQRRLLPACGRIWPGRLKSQGASLCARRWFGFLRRAVDCPLCPSSPVQPRSSSPNPTLPGCPVLVAAGGDRRWFARRYGRGLRHQRRADGGGFGFVNHFARGPVIVATQLLEMGADLVRHRELVRSRIRREKWPPLEAISPGAIRNHPDKNRTYLCQGGTGPAGSQRKRPGAARVPGLCQGNPPPALSAN
jgi:hypothetical protein